MRSLRCAPPATGSARRPADLAAQPHARRRVGRFRQLLDVAAGVERALGLLGAPDHLVLRGRRVREAVDLDRAARPALVAAAGQRGAERAAAAALAAGRVAEAGEVPVDAPAGERRPDQALARQADDLEGDLARAAVAEVDEAELALADAGAAAAAVGDGLREVLAPQLELAHGPEGRRAADS